MLSITFIVLVGTFTVQVIHKRNTAHEAVNNKPRKHDKHS